MAPTVEGDATVVYPSAVSSDVDESYFFNIYLYKYPNNEISQHRDLLNTEPIQNILTSIIRKGEITETNFILQTKPEVVDIEDQLIISSHSPVFLGAYDQDRNFTGIDQNQDPFAEVLSIKEEIPGSAFLYTGEGQYIFLPKEGMYDFVYKGTDNGLTTVTIDNFSADEITPIVSFEDMPTTIKTEASFVVQSAEPENTEIEINLDGDGDIDIVFNPTPDDLIAPYYFSGFLQPINDNTYQENQALSVFKAGSTIPVKFQLKAVDGTILQTITPPAWIAPEVISSMNASVDEPFYAFPETIGNDFKWDPTSQQYIYNWKTKGLKSGKWYKISVKLDNGGTYNTVVGLK